MIKYKYNPFTGDLDMVAADGGVNSGGNENVIAVLLSKTAQNTVDFTASPHPNTLTWTVKKNGVAVIPSMVKITKTEGSKTSTLEEISSPDSNTGTCDASISFLGTTTFKITVVVEGQTKTATVSVSAILPIYVGFGLYAGDDGVEHSTGTTQSGGLSFESLISEGYLNSYVSANLDNVTTLYNPEDGYKLIIAVPQGKTLGSIISGLFSVPMRDPIVDTILLNDKGYSYNVYRAYDPYYKGEMENLEIIIK